MKTVTINLGYWGNYEISEVSMKWQNDYLWELRTDHLKNIRKYWFPRSNDKDVNGFTIVTPVQKLAGRYNKVKITKQTAELLLFHIDRELEYRQNPNYLEFFRQFFNNRSELTALLVWADWCDDNQMPERAEELRNVAKERGY